MVTREVGHVYAYRHTPRAYWEPILQALMVKEGPTKRAPVKIRFLSGEYEGLEQWVPKARLFASWADVDAIVRDEQLLAQAVKLSGDVRDTPLWHTVKLVFRLFPGPHSVGLGMRATDADMLYIEQFDSAVPGLGLDREWLLSAEGSYFDRSGEYRAPFPVAEAVARLIAKRFALEILSEIESTERYYVEALVRGWVLGNEGEMRFVDRQRMQTKLDQYQAEMLGVREWCGEEGARTLDMVRLCQKEIERLYSLVDRAVTVLKRHDERFAQRLHKELGGAPEW